MTRTRVRLAWTVAGLELEAIEPTAGEVAAVAADLAEAYNDPANATLLGHVETMTQGDVIEHYADLADAGARQFLLYVDGALAGDADLRGEEDAAAEFAFLIARPGAQGKGLGTRFAKMLHVFGFTAPPLGMGLERIYASVLPDNVASLRVFAKLGYREDPSPSARVWADDPADVVLAISRDGFAEAHPDAFTQVSIRAR